MKRQIRRLTVGLFLLLATGFAVTAPRGIQFTDVLLWTFLLIFWIGLPLLFVGALVWEAARTRIASLRRPIHLNRAPDTDLMA